jgi:sialic acid synthase SpsE
MKIASFEITHIPLLKHIGKMGIPVLLSTGMANIDEIQEAIDAVGVGGEKRIAIFHCGIQYPLPFEAVNLRAMQTLIERFSCPVGYSDHTLGLTVPVAATALGAQLLEKHVTLEGGTSADHDFALTIDQFKEMVDVVRQCEKALGTRTKEVQEVEIAPYRRGRRSCFVIQKMKKGDVFTYENLAVLRPGIGMHPRIFDLVLGKKAARDIQGPALLNEGDWIE